MKKAKKIIIPFILIIALLFLIIAIDRFSIINSSYILNISSNTDGYGIAGQYLEGDIKEKEYFVKDGDTLDEDLNKNKANTKKPILKIKSFNEDSVDIEIYKWAKWETINLKYNEKYNYIPGYTVAMDGPVLDITIEFKKCK